MKREDVEALLYEADHFGGDTYTTMHVRVETLAALCRRWLAVEDAPAGEAVEVGYDETGQPRVLIHSTRDDLMRGPPLAFRRVRIVPEQGEADREP